jgi:hypothetical protein
MLQASFFWSLPTIFFRPQVARAILENPNDKTKVHLIYANVTTEDILLKVNNLFFYVQTLIFVFVQLSDTESIVQIYLPTVDLLDRSYSAPI